MVLRAAISCLVVGLYLQQISFAEGADAKLVEQLGQLNSRLAEPNSERAKAWQQTLASDYKRRKQAANLRESSAFAAIKTKADWEAFRDQRIEALRRSLGEFPTERSDLRIQVTGKKEFDGFTRENILYESRPGLVVTANLYRPTKPSGKKPGILISHSHHNPKWESELQDMGSIWARQGCVVLVPDHLGHGERRQHPFVNSMSFAGAFRPSRQDYYFRHNVALQLHLAGESLMGWMAWDLTRGVDVLLQRPEVDPQKIVLFGAVAGGGDPAGVTAALDPRIAVAAPFNFGCAQPDYSTPENTDRDFYWFADPYWETTRCLRWGARDGFAHWAIVSSVAPRKLLFCYEFGWDPAADPAWPRIQKAFELEGASGHLAFAHGTGNLRGRPPESSHCNNIGAVHRKMIYPVLEKWLGLPVPESDANQNRESSTDLTCYTDGARQSRPIKPARELASELAAARSAKQAGQATSLEQVRREWAVILGGVELPGEAKEMEVSSSKEGALTTTRVVLETAPGIEVPLILLSAEKGEAKRPCVIGIAQQGKEGFLKNRAKVIAELLESGVNVCLPDLRGTGETSSGGRDWRGSGTTWSQGEQLFGGTSIGSRLRDLRCVIRYLQNRPDIADKRLAIWGDSFAKANGPDTQLAVPLDADLPSFGEPSGGILALLAGLYDDKLQGIASRGSLVSYQALLRSPFVYVPADATVPGAIPAGDLELVAAQLAPRRLRIEAPIDGHNQLVTEASSESGLAKIAAAFKASGGSAGLEIKLGPPQDESLAAWFLQVLQQK